MTNGTTNQGARGIAKRITAGAVLLAFLGACATSQPSRQVANEPTITEIQFENLGEAGVGILRLAILANEAVVISKLDEQTKAKLLQIDEGSRASVRKVAYIAGGAGLLAFAVGSWKFMVENFVLSLSGGGDPNLLSVAGGSVTIAAAVVLSSTSSGKSQSQSLTRQEREEVEADAVEKQAAARRELQAQVARLTQLYGKVFSLSSRQIPILQQAISHEIQRLGRETPGQAVQLNVPRLMNREKLITNEAFLKFEERLSLIESSLRSTTELRQTLSAQSYQENVEGLKAILRAYAGWVEDAIPSMPATSPVRVNATKAVTETKRLLERI